MTVVDAEMLNGKQACVLQALVKKRELTFLLGVQ